MLDANDLQKIREIVREEIADNKAKEAGQSIIAKEKPPTKKSG